jgi:hypothetical protein
MSLLLAGVAGLVVACKSDGNQRPGASGAGGGNAQSETGSKQVGGTGGSASNSVDSGASSGPASCTELARVVCGQLANCEPFRFANDYGTTQDCQARFEALCENYESTGRPLDMAACARAVTAPDCHVVIAYAGAPSVCRFPLGSAADGASCGRDSDCQSLLCEIKNDCGTCRARGPEGASCAAVDDCGVGLICAQGACTAPVGPGAACNLLQDNRCPAGTFCIDSTCKPQAREGEACDTLNSCSTGAGFLCSDSKCIALHVAAEGEPCGSAARDSVCGFDLVCTGAGQDAVCSRRVGLGEACTSRGQCPIPLSCTNGVCGYEQPSSCH